MEVALKLEDDLFFADLNKQISLLIMDDDEDPVANCRPVTFQEFSSGYQPNAPSTFTYEPTGRSERKGTGVFIPRSSQTRRKTRQGRRTAFNSKSNNKQHDNTRMVSRHLSHSKSSFPK